MTLINGWMPNSLVNMMSTSEFDETGKVCSIWTKCDCVYFFDIEALFWYNGAASLVVGAWSKTHNKIQKKNYKLSHLFICYKLCLFHQILKFSSCSQENLPWNYLLMKFEIYIKRKISDTTSLLTQYCYDDFQGTTTVI